MRRSRDPVGVLLAGGAGRRLGGDKARVALAGRPLAQWALGALAEVLDDVVVACRLDTELPALRGVAEAWVEPDGPRGPVGGLSSALREARGRPILACSLNLPLITPAVLRTLLEAPHGAPAVVPQIGDRIEPLVGRWAPAALPILAALPPDASLNTAARALRASTVEFDADDPAFTCVHAPEDLLRAAALLDTHRPPHLHVVG
jgi:molybdenum cofactor guanylyltransferase